MKAAIYCRLSEEDKHKSFQNEDSDSIKNQKAMLTEYANEQGWEIYKIYSDDDYAGADRSRPAFNRLLDDAEHQKFDIILCKTQSRFTRELELVEKYIHGLFPAWGIRFISIVDHADTENKGNKKARQINGLINEWYLEDMSENIRSVLTNKRKNGYHIGSFALYGYKKDPFQKGHLLIDEEAASTVQEVFRLFSEGYGKTAIARILNEKGIPNPTEYKRQKGLRYQQPSRPSSTLWNDSAISSMLKNEMYIGNMVQGKYGSISYKTKENKPRPKEDWFITKHTHEAIIDSALWENVQNLLAQKTKPFQNGKLGIFSGKIRCGSCGHLLRSSKSKGKYYLQCPTRYLSKHACEGVFISVARLEAMIIKEIHHFSEQYLLPEFFQKISFDQDDLQEEKAKVQEALHTYKQKSEEYENVTKTLYIDKTKGIISEKEFIDWSKEFKAEQENLFKKMQAAEKEWKTLEEKSKESAPSQEQLLSLCFPDTLSREIVHQLIDHIVIKKENPNTKEKSIEIHWNF